MIFYPLLLPCFCPRYDFGGTFCLVGLPLTPPVCLFTSQLTLQYQILLLGDGGNACFNNLSKVALDSAEDRIEPAISSRRSNTQTTTPQKTTQNIRSLRACSTFHSLTILLYFIVNCDRLVQYCLQ